MDSVLKQNYKPQINPPAYLLTSLFYEDSLQY